MTQSDALVERLRGHLRNRTLPDWLTIEQAADRIDSLEARLAAAERERDKWRDWSQELTTNTEKTVEAAETRIAELERERGDMAEQLSLRDNRDRDMQAVMRLNNELLVRAEVAEAKLASSPLRAAEEICGG